MCKYSYIHVKADLDGPEGYPVTLMGEVIQQMRFAWCTEEQCNEYFREARVGDYHHLLEVSKRYVNCEFENEPEAV